MNRTAVSSSNIRSIGYDGDHSLLEVEFKAGSLYQYAGVPAAEYKRFMNAPSKGSHFDQFIKDQYPTTRIK
jgi:hypothetical protein